ncbi:MAG TPA: phage tail tape measure protein [Pseudomonas sp.]|nr:phage tail tape measure protein [Pseudomonas sp.]MBB49177.1 phage tail tape measure protein [Pseudomonadales bacterium]MBF77478.1 phage tail tape measure protein [Pseudomonadales bacterium]HCA23118.1 phage tail tape measure protein [Pseudomonas sp.]|tara:strand:- start:14278 stop:16791 length:2514 start_codon:yes stop_codon:yes gene_type:complete
MAQKLKLEVVLQALDRATKPIRAITQGSVGLGRELKTTRDQLKQLQRQQGDISSWRTLNNATKQTTQAISANRDRVRELSRQMAQTSTPTRALSNDFRRAVREAHALKQKHQEQQRQLQGLRGKLNEAGISTRNLGEHERTLRQRIDSTNNQLQEQERRLKAVTAQQQRLARAKQQYQRTQAMTGAMAGTGAAGLATGSAMLYSGARLLAPGIEFDSDVSRVQALARLERDSAELAALRAQARALGAATQFSANEAAQGQGFLAMAGFSPQAIMDAMPAMLDAAKAGNVELATTADIASNILTGFNLQARDMTRVSDVLTAAFTRSNTSLEMLGETMKYAAPNAAAYGQDIEIMAAAAGKLGDAGIQGGMAGTALRAILSRLAAPPRMAADAIAELGLQVADAEGNMRPLPDLLKEIHDRTAALGSTERGAILKAIAGEEAGSALTVLTQQAGNGGLQTLIGQLRTAQGEAARTAQVMGDNLGGDIAALKSVWADLGIQMQDTANSDLRGMIQALADMVRGIRQWMVENPLLARALIKIAIGLAALITLFGALTIALASILGPFAMIRLGLSLFGVKAMGLLPILKAVGTAFMWLGRALLLNPIGLAITLLVTAGWLLYKNWDGVIGGLKALWADLGRGAKAIWAEITTAFDGGILGVGQLIANWSPLGMFYKAFAAVLSWFGIELPGNLIDGLISGLNKLWPNLLASLSRLTDKLPEAVRKVLGIKSPSRVFAELGGFTMQGLAQGIQRQQGEPLAAVAGVSQRMASAADGIRFDSRRPLSARPAYAGSTGSRYEIHIHAAAGMNPQAIAHAVAAELDRRERAAGARARSSLYDQE